MGKVMSYRNRKYAGFLLVELIVALTILAMLLAGMAFSLNGMAKFNRYQLTRQQCIAAAQAELDSLTAMGRPIPDEDFERLWPELRVSIDKTPGTGQWRGMELVEVTASGKSFRKQVQIKLSRYILRDEPLAEGK
jgi:type II secretory pathway pseudopilin PulG